MYKKSLIYLAIPYTGIEEYSFMVSCKLSAWLMDRGKLVFSPIAHSHPIHYEMVDHAHDHEFWMEYNTGMMERCQELYVVKLAGWTRSVGVKHEIGWFVNNHRPIFFIEVNDNENVIIGGLQQGIFRKKQPAVIIQQLDIFQLLTG